VPSSFDFAFGECVIEANSMMHHKPSISHTDAIAAQEAGTNADTLIREIEHRKQGMRS
jgi:hypothetical protein